MHLPVQDKPLISFDIDKNIFYKENILTDSQCQDIISFGENNVRASNNYKQSFNVKFDTCLLPLNHQVHESLENSWEEIINFFNFSISFVEPYELKRYNRGCFFANHTDNYFILSENIDRKLTLSVQLSNATDYTGGELIIYNKKFKLNKGSIIAFPSYLNHEVRPIINGIRWSLIGWAWGPNWK